MPFPRGLSISDILLDTECSIQPSWVKLIPGSYDTDTQATRIIT